MADGMLVLEELARVTTPGKSGSHSALFPVEPKSEAEVYPRDSPESHSSALIDAAFWLRSRVIRAHSLPI
jgi:hypothetical protein